MKTTATYTCYTFVPDIFDWKYTTTPLIEEWAEANRADYISVMTARDHFCVKDIYFRNDEDIVAFKLTFGDNIDESCSMLTACEARAALRFNLNLKSL